jgi:hypothetical protein
MKNLVSTSEIVSAKRKMGNHTCSAMKTIFQLQNLPFTWKNTAAAVGGKREKAS